MFSILQKIRQVELFFYQFFVLQNPCLEKENTFYETYLHMTTSRTVIFDQILVWSFSSAPCFA